MAKPLRKAPIKYVQRPGEASLEQKLKVYHMIAKSIENQRVNEEEE